MDYSDIFGMRLRNAMYKPTTILSSKANDSLTLQVYSPLHQVLEMNIEASVSEGLYDELQ